MRKKSLALSLMLAFSCIFWGNLMGQTKIPYNENFDSMATYSVPTNWSKSEGSLNVYSLGTPYYSSPNCVRFGGFNITSTIAVLPEFQYQSNTLQISFYHKSGGNNHGTFEIGYVSSNTFYPISTYSASNTTTTYSQETVSLSSAPENARIAFRHSCASSQYWYIDDVSVTLYASSCLKPTSLSCNTTSSTTAYASWTAGGSETEWLLYYSKSSTAPADDVYSGTGVVTVINDASYTLEGLDDYTTYYVWVRAKCGEDDYSDWTDVVSFTTLNPQSLPVTNNFEDGEDDLEDWTMRDANANTGVYDSETYGSSSYCFRFYSPYSGSTQYLITPELNGTTNGVYVQFYRKQPYAGAWIQVGYSTETISTEDFTWSDATPNAAATKYVSYELYCPANTKFVAIKYTSTTSTPVYIDNISITVPPTANTNGNWNNAATWATGAVPSSSANVVISSNVTIPNGYTATANNITIDGGSLTIADGGQLICNNAVQATVQKNVSAAANWGTSSSYTSDGWYFIAAPVNGATFPTGSVATQDIYQLDWANNIWLNLQNSGNSELLSAGFQRGTGYLYASKDDNTISVAGEIQPLSGSDNATVTLANDGWNLIGNPLTCAVTVDKDFSELNGGSAVTNQTSGSTINPFQGIAVYGDAGTTVTFTKADSQNAVAPSNNSSLQMTLSQTVATRGAASSKVVDNAIVNFNGGSDMPKFKMLEGNANIFIPQNGEDYAIASSNHQGEMPLNFKANEVGTYTISFSGEVNGVYLIDMIDKQEVNLSANPSYTFIGSPADRSERFKIVFRNTSNDIFAYQNGSDIVVTGEGELQIFDVMGRIVSKQYVNGVGTWRAASVQNGVYIFRLNGMTQKIVVR